MACQGCNPKLRRTLFTRRILIYAAVGGAVYLGYRAMRRS